MAVGKKLIDMCCMHERLSRGPGVQSIAVVWPNVSWNLRWPAHLWPLTFNLHLYCPRYHKNSKYRALQSPVLSSMNEDGSGESAVPTQGGSVSLVLSAYYRHGSIRNWHLCVGVAQSIGGRPFMLMNLLNENGDISKHWELVPLANSYNVRAFGPLDRYSSQLIRGNLAETWRQFFRKRCNKQWSHSISCFLRKTQISTTSSSNTVMP